MSRRNRRNASQTRPASNGASTGDSFVNLAAKLGANATNLQGGSAYLRTDNLTRNYTQLEAMYRTSGIIRKAIDAVADDMTREGVQIQSDDDPDDHKAIGQAMDRLGLWDALGDGVRWGRLYGGAIGVYLIDGQDMATPLNLDTVRKGQFKGMHVMDRWQVQPSISDKVTEFGPMLGKPASYNVTFDGSPLQGRTIHYTRLIRFKGAPLPYRQAWIEQWWDQSYIEQWFDRLVQFDSTTAGAAQLVHKAHLRSLKIKDLREVLATGGPEGVKALYNQVEFMRVAQTIEGLTMMDGEDEFQTNTYSFAGLDSVLTHFEQQLCAVTDYPMVRLFGTSPGGLNATGDSDLSMYYARIKRDQERDLRQPLGTVFDLLHRSELGRPIEDDFDFQFNALDPMSDQDKADIFGKVASAIQSLTSGGILMRPTALREMKAASEITGYGKSITDEDITDAENDPPPIPDAGPTSAEVEGAEGTKRGTLVRGAATKGGAAD